MSEDQTPVMRVSVRTHPGTLPIQKRSVGRQMWISTARFISFMGGVTAPFSDAWKMSGLPAGDGAKALTSFMTRFGHPAIQHVNEAVYIPRAETSPYTGLAAFLENSDQTMRSTTDTQRAVQQVLSTRYDAVMSQVQSMPE